MEDRRRKSLINVLYIYIYIDVESVKLTGGLISPTVNDQCYCQYCVHSRSPRSDGGGGVGLTGSTLHCVLMHT